MDAHAQGSKRKVTGDPAALYFGTVIDDHSLVPGDDARKGTIRYEE